MDAEKQPRPRGVLGVSAEKLRSARARSLLESSHALLADGLGEPMRRCLNEFEQHLFKQAERARLPALQQDYLVSRQRMLENGANFLQEFIAALANAFDDIDKTSAQSSAPAPAHTWQTLELLAPADQELSMAVSQICTRGDSRHSNVLQELGYRLAVLVGTAPLEGESLPLSPHSLVQALHQASKKFELPLEHELLLLKYVDKWLIQTIAPLYAAISAHLATEGILPHLRGTPMPRHGGHRPQPPASGPAAKATAATETTQAAPPTAQPHGDSIEVLESLRDLLAQRRLSSGRENSQPPGRIAHLDELQVALSALQQHLAQMTGRASRELRSAQRLREELLIQLNISTPSGAPRTQLSGEQGDAVELVAMLFDQLSQQLQRDSKAHALIENMQLPVLRMAVADQAFFENQEHPARKLLDAVASAANDWLDGSDDKSSRPLAAKLDQLVARANQEPPSAGLYTSLLADIEHHLALLSRKADAAERRHVEAAQGRERLDQARRRASELMAERFKKSPPRGLLRALLDRAWSDVLALTLLRHGEDSDEFGIKLAITDQLLGHLPTGDRQQLQLDVEAGLHQIGMHDEEATQVAQRLLNTDDAQPAEDLPSATDLAERLKQHQRLGEPAQAEVAEPPVASPPSSPVDSRAQAIEQQLRKIPFGTWFEFIDPADGHITKRKLAWYSPMSGRCLLVSRRGQRGEEMTLAQLAVEIASRRAREMPTGTEGVLDRAWRGLVGILRPPVGVWRTSFNREPLP